MNKNIAVLEGDGIGPEIMAEAIKVLKVIAQKYRHSFNLNYASFGANAYLIHQDPFPQSTKDICDKADAILKGPIGLAVTDMNSIPTEMRPEAAVLSLRKRYDTFANYRPVVLPKSLADFSPLRPEIIGEGIDILMMRELVGGIYFGKKVEGIDRNMESATDDCTYTGEQIERFAYVAFEEARKKGNKLTNVHKANALATSRLWNAVFEEIAKQYPDVKVTSMLVDNVAYQLVINPSQFNGVMALENFQGDILTDLGAGIIGSLGLMPSACLNPKTGKGYFEPAHGSAPDIAGQNISNPYSMIGCIAFMLEKSFSLNQESNVVWEALNKVFADGFRTKELARNNTILEKIISTTQFGDKVTENILNYKEHPN